MVRPETERQVAHALVDAQRNGQRVRVRGGGVSAVPPTAGDVDLDLTGLRGIVNLRAGDGVLVVRAGTPLIEVREALREAGRRLPLEPWTTERATIGGAVAAAADGLVSRGGLKWRDLVLGLRAVLPSGEAVAPGASVVKSVAGYDVGKALVGSRGTLAVITLLHLRIEPLEPASATLFKARMDPRSVALAVAEIDALPWAPAALVATLARDGRYVVLHVRYDGPPAAVDGAARQLEKAGFRRPNDATRHWADLTAAVSRPAAVGLNRRMAPCSRRDTVARFGTNVTGGWISDLVRGRVTWIDGAPPPPPDPATTAVFERVRQAFDPESLLAPGRGHGAP